MIKINNLYFKREENIIFSGIDLQIRRNKITAIMGPSGSGKTTLLNLIGAQLYPDSGQILINNQNVHALHHKELFMIRQRMGLLFQSAALFTHLSVFENVAFPLREHTNLPESIIRKIVLMKLQGVGLRGASEMMPNDLSGGMSRRVALARAIALDPSLIMYDEPFAGQDPISMGVILKLIKRLNEVLHMTSIIVSHDVHETIQIADYIYIIANGKVMAEGTPDALESTDSSYAQQFLQGLADGAVPFHYPAKDYVEDLLNG